MSKSAKLLELKHAFLNFVTLLNLILLQLHALQVQIYLSSNRFRAFYSIYNILH